MKFESDSIYHGSFDKAWPVALVSAALAAKLAVKLRTATTLRKSVLVKFKIQDLTP